MPRSRFEKFLPWAGVIAAVCWVAQMFIAKTGTEDVGGGAQVSVLRDTAILNMVHMGVLTVMGMAIVFFAAACSAALRTREAGEASASAVAFGGWLLVSAALGQMALRRFALLESASDGNDLVTTTLGYLDWPGWIGMMAGTAVAWLGIGFGGLHGKAFPKWFSITTIVLGILLTLGAVHIPPGGIVGYLVLPFWLVTASILLVRQRSREQAASIPLVRQRSREQAAS